MCCFFLPGIFWPTKVPSLPFPSLPFPSLPFPSPPLSSPSPSFLFSVDVTAGVSGQQEVSEQQRAEAEAAAVAAQRQAENLEHAQLRAQLEEATLPLMLDAMWAANVLDIENTLRHVCKKVSCPLGIEQAGAFQQVACLEHKSHSSRP